MKDLYNLHRSEYRKNYFTGLKGLNEQALSSYKEAVKDKVDIDKLTDDDFRGWILKQELENNEDADKAELWLNRATKLNTPLKRDATFANMVLNKGFDDESDIKDYVVGASDWTNYALMNLASSHAYGRGSMPAAKSLDTSIDSNIITKKMRLEDKLTLRDQARDFIYTQEQNMYDTYAQTYHRLPKYNQDKILKNVYDLSKAVSPDYYGYYGQHDTASRSKETLEDVAIRNWIWNDLVGDKSSQLLSEYWQDYVANRQTKMEKLGNSGLNFLNSAASTGFMAIGLVYGLLGAPLDNEDLKNDKYWTNILDNAVTRWAGDIFTTGHWDPEVQNVLKSLGVNANAILNTREQERSLMSGNTPYELFGQYGFTAASMLMAGGLGKLGQAPMAIARNAVTTGKAFTKFGRAMTKAHMWSANAWQKAVPFLIAGPESNLEALTTWEESRQAGLEDINKKIESIVDKDIYDYVVNNPEEAEKKITAIRLAEFVKSENKGYVNLDFGEYVMDPNTGKYKKQYSEISLKHMAQILSKNQEFRKQYQEAREKDAVIMQNALEESKTRQLYTTFAANQIVLGGINSTLQATQLSSFTRRALAKNNAGRIANMIDFVEEANKVGIKAAAKKVTWKNLITDRFKESIGEGLEEYEQALITAFGTGSTKDLVDQYISRLYDGKAIDAVVEDMSSMIWAGLRYAGDAATKKSTIKEALYGTLSTLLGGPSVNTNISFGTKREGESTYDMLRRNSPIVWRGLNEAFFSSAEKNARQKENEDMANAINAFLSDESNLNLIFNIAENVNTMRAYNNAIRNNDEKGARDSKVDILFGFASMMASLRKTAFYNTTMHMLEQRANVDRRNLSNPESKESKMVQQYKEETGDTEMYNEDILESLSKSAKNTIDIIKQAQKEASSISSMYGENISLPVQNALISAKLHEKDIEKRIKTMSNEYSHIDFSEPDGTTPSSNLPIEIQKGYARFGNYSQSMKRKQQLTDYIKDLKNKRSIFESYQNQNEDLSFALKSQISTLKYLEDSAKKELEELEEYKTELEKLDTNDRDNIVLTAYDISRLDSKSRQRLLNTKRKHITVTEEVDGKETTRRVLDPNHRNLSSKQYQEIDKFRRRGRKSDNKFDEKIDDLAILQQDLEYYEHMEMFYRTNPQALFSMSKQLEKEIAKKLASKRYEYLSEEDNEVNKDLDTFRQELTDKLNQARSKEEREAIEDAAKKSPHWKNYRREVKEFEKLKQEIQKTDIYNKLSQQEKDDILLLLNTAFYKYGNLSIETSNAKFDTIISSITEEDVSNFISTTKSQKTLSDLGSALMHLVPAFDEVKKEANKREQRTTPVNIKKTTPENNTPQRSDGPVFEGPVVENSRTNPTVILSEEDLINRGATPSIIKFYKDNNILDNITRLITEGKLTTKDSTTKQPTQVYFTVDRIGHYYEVIQLVEDNNGQYIVEGKKYSVIGIETDANAFTTEDKKDANVKKLLSKTASVTKVDTQRVTGKSSNLKDIAPGHEDSVIKNLTVAQRKTSAGEKKEMVYSSRTGIGGTVYTSSVSDTPIDQVKLTEDKTAIDLLFEYKNLPLEERKQKATELLKHLDYSKNNYYYNQIIELIESIKGKDKLSAKDINDLNKNINNIFKQLYFLGQTSDGILTQFVFNSNDNSLSLQIKNEGIDNFGTQERSIALNELTQDSFLEMFLSTLAEASVDNNGKPIKYSKKNNVLSFEIGLQDLELINNPLALRGLSGKEATAMSRRIDGKKGFLKDKIALGALQLTNNQADLSPKSIKLSFNYDGKTTLNSQIIPESNSDTTDSRSNTVETTTGEVVDGDTGVTITPNSSEIKITDEVETKVKEEETQPVDSTMDTNDPLGVKESKNETTEEDEEEISASDMRNIISEDDEFGALYKRDSNHPLNKKVNIDKNKALKILDINKYLKRYSFLSEEDAKQIIFDLVDRLNSATFGEILYDFSSDINEEIEQNTISDEYKQKLLVIRDIMTDLVNTFVARNKCEHPTKIVQAQKITHQEYKDLFKFYNKSTTNEELFNLVFETAKQLGIEFFISSDNGVDLEYQGAYYSVFNRFGKIEIPKIYLNSSWFSNESKAKTLLHELIHSVTSKAIHFVEGYVKIPGVVPSKTLVKAVAELKAIYKELENKEEIKSEYGMKNIHEMLAELANPEFLQKIYRAQPLWKKLIDKFSTILTNLYNKLVHKNKKVTSMTSKAIRKNLNIIMKESIKIGSLTGAKIYTYNNLRHLQQYKKQQVNSLQHSNNALTESWDWMSDRMKESLIKRGLTQEVWEQLTPEEKEKAIECR